LDTKNLIGLIDRYYEYRNLTRPTPEQAMMWAASELGECFDMLLSKHQWVRNNPDKHPPFTQVGFGEECGDLIMMLIVSAQGEGVDPFECLESKLLRKMGEVKQVEKTAKRYTKEETAEAMCDPKAGDVYSEMCVFWVLVADVNTNKVTIFETSANWGEAKKLTLTYEEFVDRYKYKSSSDYYVRLYHRGRTDLVEKVSKLYD
jgi:NTP pyrophosphatase (non-canonical NTP hydrolase)